MLLILPTLCLSNRTAQRRVRVRKEEGREGVPVKGSSDDLATVPSPDDAR